MPGLKGHSFAETIQGQNNPFFLHSPFTFTIQGNTRNQFIHHSSFSGKLKMAPFIIHHSPVS